MDPTMDVIDEELEEDNSNSIVVGVTLKDGSVFYSVPMGLKEDHTKMREVLEAFGDPALKNIQLRVTTFAHVRFDMNQVDNSDVFVAYFKTDDIMMLSVFQWEGQWTIQSKLSDSD